MFGEVYPDPVRVISVEHDIAQMVSDPSAPQWASNSVEFCGGTHLSATGEARAFVVTEETAVAKGIRRIVAITGELAEQAHIIGDSFIRTAITCSRTVLS